MNFNRRPDDFTGYVILVDREKNLTQSTQSEEGTEFTEKNNIQKNEARPDEQGRVG
jgi:hypothetical protein